MGAMRRLGGELANVDTHLEAEGLRLKEEWRHLKVAINFGRLQHEHANVEAEASLATSREASARALEEAREADRRRAIVEERRRELLALNASLEQQVEARWAALASMKEAPAEEEEIRKREEAMVSEATEQSLELERLETRERLVAQAKDAANAREARIQEGADSEVAEARELEGAGADARRSVLRSRLVEMEQREKATAAALVFVQAELASARTKLLLLQQRITAVKVLVID
nr:cilia- and flagella-associated protein 45-like [Aegilops tauschii subsp. strangulata]